MDADDRKRMRELTSAHHWLWPVDWYGITLELRDIAEATMDELDRKELTRLSEIAFNLTLNP